MSVELCWREEREGLDVCEETWRECGDICIGETFSA